MEALVFYQLIKEQQGKEINTIARNIPRLAQSDKAIYPLQGGMAYIYFWDEQKKCVNHVVCGLEIMITLWHYKMVASSENLVFVQGGDDEEARQQRARVSIEPLENGRLMYANSDNPEFDVKQTTSGITITSPVMFIATLEP